MSIQAPVAPEVQESKQWRPGQAEIVLVTVLALIFGNGFLTPLLDSPALRTWSAMFMAIVIQSLPFLILGVLVAAAISHLLSERLLKRLVPTNAALAVPVAGVAGVGLAGCECASVPIAGSIMRRGVAPGVALTFLLAAPAVNPIVMVSTAVAFPGKPEMVFARFAASMLTAVIVGWLWVWKGRSIPLNLLRVGEHDHGHRLRGFLNSVQHDFLQTSGFLVLGAMIAAAVNTFVPSSTLDSIGQNPVLAILALAAFAFIVALCSQTDAFIAASLVSFSYTARLVFLVVGPAMDIKLALLEAGTFGRRFAAVFVPLVLVVAVASAVCVGWVLL